MKTDTHFHSDVHAKLGGVGGWRAGKGGLMIDLIRSIHSPISHTQTQNSKWNCNGFPKAQCPGQLHQADCCVS